jgi:predicted alpha/beta superfamily hydrolase
MIKKHLVLIFLFSLLNTSLFAQNFERYKKLKDTVIKSTNLGFDKNISITVPIEWQKGTKNKFPIIIIFDRQNKRSHNYIINTIDYLTSNEQIPSTVIISVESERFRYSETSYKISDSSGLALENEKFIFEELIPLAEKNFNASSFRTLIGHSRYGYFTTALFNTRINSLNAVISLSPYFIYENTDLTDTISQLNKQSFNYKKYYRFVIGNDYPEQFNKMDSVLKKLNNPFLDIKGHHFKEADHNVTPGLLISTALYEIFEYWAAVQSKYRSNDQNVLGLKPTLDREIIAHYGVKLNLSLGILNGKGWGFYNAKQYENAIEAWNIMLETYPNFSQGY